MFALSAAAAVGSRLLGLWFGLTPSVRNLAFNAGLALVATVVVIGGLRAVRANIADQASAATATAMTAAAERRAGQINERFTDDERRLRAAARPGDGLRRLDGGMFLTGGGFRTSTVGPCSAGANRPAAAGDGAGG